MDSDIVPMPPRRDLARIGFERIPAVIARAGENASRRYIEFFAANIRNPNTRRAYLRAAVRFFDWCTRHRIRDLDLIESFQVAAYIEERGREVKKPAVKQELAAIRMLFDWLVVGQIVPSNPASHVRGPKHVVRKGKTSVLSTAEARQLLESIDTSTVVGLRDRAIIATMLYTFGRVGAAVVSLKVEDAYVQDRRLWLRLHEKGGKVLDLPCHHKLEEYLYAYLDAAGIQEEKTTPLFRSTVGRTKTLTDRRLHQRNVYGMIHRRAEAAGIKTKLGCHSMRGTGITNFLENGGTVEAAQRMAGHADPRTTKLYDRRGDQVSLDDVERITF